MTILHCTGTECQQFYDVFYVKAIVNLCKINSKLMLLSAGKFLSYDFPLSEDCVARAKIEPIPFFLRVEPVELAEYAVWEWGFSALTSVLTRR